MHDTTVAASPLGRRAGDSGPPPLTFTFLNVRFPN